MKTSKVKIFQENEDFLDKILQFLSKNSKQFYRDVLINEILCIFDSTSKSLESLSPITLDTKYGSTYQSKYRDSIDLTSVSHFIKHLSIEGNNIYGIIDILDTPIGTPIQSLESEDIILKPVYNNKGEIITFDIDFNINKAA